MSESITIDLGDVQTAPPDDKPLHQLLIPVPNTEHDFQFSIDNSSLERVTTCARAAEYYIVHRREAAVNAPALAFGSAIHSALELKYRHGDSPSTRAVQLEHVAATLQNNPPPIGDHRTLDRALEVVEKYNKTYPNEAFTVARHPVTDEPMVELRFEEPLGKIDINDWVPVWPSLDTSKPGLKFRNHMELTDDKPEVFIGSVYVLWTGRIDLIARMDGMYWIMDHKTTQMMGPQFFDDFNLNNATVGYTWAGRRLLDAPVAGLILNALCVRKPTKTGTATEFDRRRFLYTPEQLDEWHHNTLVLVSDFLHHLRRGYFPMETKWCFAKYGKCQFHEVCMLPQKDRPEMLRSPYFRNVTWNPLDD